MRITRLALGSTLALVLSTSPAAVAQLHDLDVVPTLDENAVIRTSRVVNTGSGQELEQDRVFDADLAFFFGFPFTEDPGINSPVETFPPFSTVSLTIVDALRVWNDGFEEIARLPDEAMTPITMELSFGDSAILSPTAPDERSASLVFAVSGLGDLHVHQSHIMDPDAPEGLYLLAFALANSSAAVGDSDPYYFVYNFGRPEEEQDVAMQWVRDNLIDAGPAADLNGDGVVDGADLGTLLGAWGACDGDCPADLNADGVIDGADLGTLLGAWG